MKTIHICQFCQKEFLTYPVFKAKFCSRFCASQNKSLKSKQLKTCPVCNKEFLTKYSIGSSANKFCSIECYRNQKITIKRICKCCGKSFSKTLQPSRLKEHLFLFCSDKCRSTKAIPPHHSGEKSSHWKGGVKHFKNGYIGILVGHCYIYEHRLVVERFLGRKLSKKEVVHHIDFNKQNNNISNLYLFSNCKEHNIYHRNQYSAKPLPLVSNLSA